MKDKKHKCIICNKEYASYKSWWNHDKKFHRKPLKNNVLFIDWLSLNLISNLIQQLKNPEIINKDNEIKYYHIVMIIKAIYSIAPSVGVRILSKM
jgi:hypothetical protein